MHGHTNVKPISLSSERHPQIQRKLLLSIKIVLDIFNDTIAFNCKHTYLTKFVVLAVLYFCTHHLGNDLVEVETYGRDIHM